VFEVVHDLICLLFGDSTQFGPVSHLLKIVLERLGIIYNHTEYQSCKLWYGLDISLWI